jgi:mono/diheme cytochrome c family protein
MVRATVFLLVLSLSGQVAAHEVGGSPSGPELEGRRLYTQSCLVCHAKPQLTAALYGPALSKESVGGQADVMREVISNGTPRMPGYRYHFTPAEIDSIVRYLKTVPVAAGAH